MKRILLLGAGRTAHFLIDYLAQAATQNGWELRIADYSQKLLDEVSQSASCISKLTFDVANASQRLDEVAKADVVISLLPAQFHILVGKTCLELGKHFLSASYVSDDFKALEKEIAKKGLLFLKETGLDPGIDHMSAMQMLDEIRDRGGNIKRFQSYTGGLMSPDHKENPWEYKFTWNPMYVVTAGRDGGMYLRNGNIKRIPYHRLFKEIDVLDMPGHGRFDAYYNRNSLKYIDAYNLDEVDTVIRYTLRREGFCEAWRPLVSLGLTDNTFEFSFKKPITNRDFLNLFIRKGEGSLEQRVSKAINQPTDSEVFKKLKWLGLFDETELPIAAGTSAAFLKEIIMPKWQMLSDEKDMIYMAHVCYYELNGELRKRKAYLAVEGINMQETAMAKTVGLPLAIAAKKLLEGKIQLRGLHIPTLPEFYNPILEELETHGIAFLEEDNSAD